MEQRTFLPVDTIRQEIKEELNSYKEFAFGRNLAGIAIALVLATSVQKFVTTFSDTLLMPIINYLVSNSSGGWGTWTVSPVPGMDFALGKFFGGLLEFIITTTVLYLIYSKIIKRLDPEAKLEKLDVERKEMATLKSLQEQIEILEERIALSGQDEALYALKSIDRSTADGCAKWMLEACNLIEKYKLNPIQ